MVGTEPGHRGLRIGQLTQSAPLWPIQGTGRSRDGEEGGRAGSSLSRNGGEALVKGGKRGLHQGRPEPPRSWGLREDVREVVWRL